jgi:hypothetical protein
MTDTTPNLALPELIAAQAQKHVTVNEALRALDALVQLAVLDRDLAVPPASPDEGQRWLIAAGASGAWAGRSGQIAAWQDGGWEFYAPQAGWLAYVADEGALLAWSGSAWVDAITAITSLNNMTLLGVGTTANATNPFSAKLNNILWVARTIAEGGDGDLRWKMSKAGASDTLSMLFQTAYSGRAELGLTGDDNFHLKVSADGTSWKEALIVDRATGGVRFSAHAVEVASASVCDIGAAAGLKVSITGTTAITSFGSEPNCLRLIRFAAALTLVHNATSLCLPGCGNIVTAAGDTALATSDASGNWTVRHYQRACGLPLLPALPTVTTDNDIVRHDGTAGNQQASGVQITDDRQISGLGGLRLTRVTIVDDAAAAIALPQTIQANNFFVELCTGGTTPSVSNPLLKIFIRSTMAVAPIVLWSSDGTGPAANIVTGTGIPTGTTGADGKLGIYANGDGNLYIENRLGGTRAYGVTPTCYA